MICTCSLKAGPQGKQKSLNIIWIPDSEGHQGILGQNPDRKSQSETMEWKYSVGASYTSLLRMRKLRPWELQGYVCHPRLCLQHTAPDSQFSALASSRPRKGCRVQGEACRVRHLQIFPCPGLLAQLPVTCPSARSLKAKVCEQPWTKPNRSHQILVGRTLWDSSKSCGEKHWRRPQPCPVYSFLQVRGAFHPGTAPYCL